MSTLIKNGYLLDPATGREGSYDLLIKDGKVSKVDKNLTMDADEIIDAEGMYVMPGFIDLHVHLREPGFEYKETIHTGSMAAAAGGFTTICPMPNTKPVIDSPEMIEFIKKKALEDSLVHIVPVGTITIGQQGKELVDFKALKEAGALAVSEDGKSVMDSVLYAEGMKKAHENGLLVMAHCEDKNLVRGGVMNAGKRADELSLKGITNAVEDIIAARDIFLSEETGARLHLCHCSTRGSAALVKMAKELGLKVTAEVCPHHFTMSDDEILIDDGKYKMNPPLRSSQDVQALKEALGNDIMDVISTDHAPHSKEEKSGSMKNGPFGIVGLETAFALTMTELVGPGYLTPMKMAEKLSFKPAQILGINKGSLETGMAADLVIADPHCEYAIDADEFMSKGRNTPFHGKKVTGRVMVTMVDGKVVYQYNKNKGE